MYKLMNKQIKDLLQSFNVAVDGKTHSKVVTLSAKIYQQCLNASDNAKGLKQLKTVVNEVLNGWKIGQNKTTNVHSERSWHENMVLALVKGNIMPIIDIRMSTDSANTSINSIGVSLLYV